MDFSNKRFISGMNSRIALLAGCLALCLACIPPTATATTINQFPTDAYGSYNNWPTTWTVIPGLNDADDGKAEQLDFVGDTTNPCGYIAWNDDYFFVRQRVDVGTVTSSTFRDATFVLIDRVGAKYQPTQPDNTPDLGLCWDSKSNDITTHGMEFQLYNISSGSTSWSVVKMDDIDSNASTKTTLDIDLSGEGYIRTVDGQSTTNFGTTTFIDYAVSWDYLNTTTGGFLQKGQTWRIQFGSVANATDHNAISADVAGGGNPVTVGLDWSEQIFPGETFDLATWLFNHPPTAIGFSLTMDQATQLAAFYNSPSGVLELGDIRWSFSSTPPADKDSRSYWEDINTADNCGFQYKVDDGDFVQNWLTGLVRPGYIMDNSALVDLSTVDANLLEDLYDTQSATPLELAGYSWSYFSDTIDGKKYGDSWIDGGKIYFYFGSGVKGEPLGGGTGDVPEPSTLLLLLPFIGFGLSKMWAKKH